MLQLPWLQNSITNWKNVVTNYDIANILHTQNENLNRCKYKKLGL